MEMNEALPDTYDLGYIHSNLEITISHLTLTDGDLVFSDRSFLPSDTITES